MNALDGPDDPQRRPPPTPAYQHFKESLHAALLAFDSLDEASLAMLQHDGDYRGGVQRLISPLPDLATSASTSTPRRLFQIPPSAPSKAKKNLRELLKQNEGIVEGVWLHLLSGSWAEGFNVDHLVGQLNAELRLLHPTDDSNVATSAQGELPLQSTNEEAVVEARMAKDRLAIAIAGRTQIHTRREVLQAFDAISELIVDRSAMVLPRNQGINSSGFRLRSRGSDPFAIDYLMRTHQDAAIDQTKNYLLDKWGPGLKVGKMRPFIDLAATDERHLCFFFACHGPFSLMKRFGTAPEDGFRIIIATKDSHFTYQVQPYDILIDGYFYMDSYHFL